MSSPLNTIISITDETLSTLECAHQALKSAEIAFKALKLTMSEYSDARHMAHMGEQFCLDQANGIDCMREDCDSRFTAALTEDLEHQRNGAMPEKNGGRP